MELKNLLELRKAMKKKKPVFIRQNYVRKKLGKKWRKPKGMHSKMRLGKAGKSVRAQAGYSSPKMIRSLHKTGLKPILIRAPKDIEEMNPKTEGAVISSKTGLKKRIELIKKALEKGITLLNIRDAGKFLEEAEKRRAEIKKQREEKKKKKPAKPAKKKKLEEKLEDEEKKKAEKKEKDKFLTKRK